MHHFAFLEPDPELGPHEDDVEPGPETQGAASFLLPEPPYQNVNIFEFHSIIYIKG
jgi:hypothetical protein